VPATDGGDARADAHVRVPDIGRREGLLRRRPAALPLALRDDNNSYIERCLRSVLLEAYDTPRCSVRAHPARYGCPLIVNRCDTSYLHPRRPLRAHQLVASTSRVCKASNASGGVKAVLTHPRTRLCVPINPHRCSREAVDSATRGPGCARAVHRYRHRRSPFQSTAKR
jgi:hypothetical protein